MVGGESGKVRKKEAKYQHTRGPHWRGTVRYSKNNYSQHSLSETKGK